MEKQSQLFFLDNRFNSLGTEFSAPVTPTALTHPKIVKFNKEVAATLGFHEQSIVHKNVKNIFSGNAPLLGYSPVAQQYAGHQFGNFNPFLGDGRSALIAEVLTQKSSRNHYWEISLKGIGPTPFSHNGDGYACLFECLHEYEYSQRLTTLNIPTVQSLCVVKGEKQVYRDGFKDSAMLTRVAPSFVRFGTFELFYFQQNIHALRTLADHIIHYYYAESEFFGKKKYAHFFKNVVIKTAELIAHWQSTGFVHGMMNTDNQSILGITMDFGSCSFTSDYNDEFVSATIDKQGRYAFGLQPTTGLWNCNVLAKALSPIIDSTDLKLGLLCYEPAYLKHYEKLTS